MQPVKLSKQIYRYYVYHGHERLRGQKSSGKKMLSFKTSKKTQNFLIAKNQPKLNKVFATKKNCGPTSTFQLKITKVRKKIDLNPMSTGRPF